MIYCGYVLRLVSSSYTIRKLILKGARTACKRGVQVKLGLWVAQNNTTIIRVKNYVYSFIPSSCKLLILCTGSLFQEEGTRLGTPGQGDDIYLTIYSSATLMHLSLILGHHQELFRYPTCTHLPGMQVFVKIVRTVPADRCASSASWQQVIRQLSRSRCSTR